MIIDHVCIAVRNSDLAVKRFCDLFGYKVKTEKITNTKQQVNVRFLSKDNSLDIKIIEPSNKESPLWSFLKKGGGLHHLCFRVDDVRKQCIELELKGLKVLTQPESGEAFDDELIAFCFAGFGLNVELIDTDKRRGIIQD